MITKRDLLKTFRVPVAIMIGIIFYCVLFFYFHFTTAATTLALFCIVLGSYGLVIETVRSLLKRQFVLDYIALLAIIVSVSSGQYLVALVIVLMLSGGNTLEVYGMARAKQSLTALAERIPNDVLVIDDHQREKRVSIGSVAVGDHILVRKGEVVPLDGVLLTDEATIDESSLTGEPYTFDRVAGDVIRSGTVNVGDVVMVRVTNVDADSTYRKIIDMVKQAEAEKAPFIRLADRYSTVFTLLALFLAAFGYIISHDATRVLAVLVVATPCPLILATPIAFFGGMNAAAKQKMLVKNLESIEKLSHATDIIFDKTGTITLGRPHIRSILVHDARYSTKDILQIAEAIERNSLHPLAKAIVLAAKDAHTSHVKADEVKEVLGKGISATVKGKRYTISKPHHDDRGNAIELFEGDRRIADFVFEDTLKDDAISILTHLERLGLSLHIFTGDKKENTEAVIQRLGDAGKRVKVHANCLPEDKKQGIASLKSQGKVTAMVGDGINDAPALAYADASMVFSNEERTAASEAADMVFLGGDMTKVWQMLMIARRTVRIAKQSIFVGIGLSVVAMLFAVFGHVPPLAGAIIQECIDIAVILNAIRASRYTDVV